MICIKKIILLCLILIFINGCKNDSRRYTLKDIAYNNKFQDDYTIYIQEDDIFEPYLVIDDNYNGKVLLIRKYLLDEEVYFSEEKSQGTNGGYYPISNIDKYLNTVHLSKFASELQDKIEKTTISVSTLEGVAGGGGVKTTENIQRKVFLLSATELNIKSGMASKEGKPISYFKKRDNWIATDNEGEKNSYWLRSAYHWDDIQAWVIGGDGSYGGASVSVSLSVRPSFCLDKKTPIKQADGVIQGEKVYVFDIQ